MNLLEIRKIIEQKKGQRELQEGRAEALINDTTALGTEIRCSEQAQAIIQRVAKDTQSQLEYHITDIVTMALETIFDEPYKFGVEFVVKRNKTECELFFERGGERIKPMDAAGGGVIDTTTFALKIALWTLQTPRSRNTIILDEPFKFLSKDLLPRSSELLQRLSDKLNLQFIIVTHLDELTECADKVFKVSICKGKSIIN